HTWQVDTIGFVPWFMYPLMLGINGLLAILTLYYLVEDKKSYRALEIFVAFMIFTFVAGRIVSIINMNFFDAGYWEKRFIWFIKPSLAALAPIPVIHLIDKLRKRNMNVNLKAVTSIVVIGTIVLCGISTTFLNVEYWSVVTNNPVNWPSSGEMEAINAFKEILDNDPKTWLATVTEKSSAIATFTASADRLDLKQLLFTAYRPEMAFTLLYRHPAYNHPYIYLHNRDLTQLGKFTDRFLAKYISMLPLVYQNSEVKIYNVSKLSPPQPNSDNVLILPLDKSLLDEQNFHMTCSILSQGLYNYTVAYDLDDKALNAKAIILAYDPPQEGFLTSSFQDRFDQTLASYNIIKGSWQTVNEEVFAGESEKYGEGMILSPILIEDYIKFLKSGRKVIILNTNGYNFFGNYLFLLENSAFDAEKIEGTKTVLNLPVHVTVPKLMLKNSSISVLSQYVGSNNESPFIVKQNYGEGELFYVNIYPIVKVMRNNGSWSTFYNILGKLLEDLNLPKIDQIILSFDGYVKEIHLNNGSKVETTSLIFPLKIAVKQLDIQTKNETITLSNVTKIEIKNYSKLLIDAENFTISNGQGFYATLKLNSTFLVKPSIGLLDLEITTGDEAIHVIQARQFSIVPYSSIQLLARTPKVSAHRVTFIEFYPLGSLKWKTRTYGQNLHVTGLTSFQILLSDSYTILKNVQLGDYFTRDPPIVMFDERSTLPTAMFWTLLLLPIFLGAVFIHSKQSSQNNREA
ncbi:MAG: hypothetical protein ACTSXW_04055, partial [Candidatus Baldrarchaeia archaeon]